MTLAAGEGETAYPEFVEEVFLSETEALRAVFPAVSEWVVETVRLSPAQRKSVERRTGWKLSRTEFAVRRALGGGGETVGYAVVAEEVGKFKPITFLVAATPKFRVRAVEVMVYREPVGREIRRKRFLRQFKNKKPSSPLRINRDVINITGATMSVRAVSAGVKRVLCVLEEIYADKE